MDRPPSQLENVRPSGLKQPSRLPAMANGNGRTLLETTQSDLNAKAATGAGSMAASLTGAGGSVKHRILGCEYIRLQISQHVHWNTLTVSRPTVPEPPTKRKTLAERAGEPIDPQRSHMPTSWETTGVWSKRQYEDAANPSNTTSFVQPSSLILTVKQVHQPSKLAATARPKTTIMLFPTKLF